LEKFEAALCIEKVLLAIDKNTSEDVLVAARKKVRSILQEYSGLELNNKLTIAETIGEIATSGISTSKRDASIFIIRLFSVPHFLPKQSSSNKIDTMTIKLIEPVMEDIYSRFDIDKKEQSYEKINKITAVHSYCIDCLNQLSGVPDKIEAIAAGKNMIQKSIGDQTLRSYLAPYDFKRIKANLEALLNQIVTFTNSNQASFARRLKELSDLLSDEIIYCEQYPTFVTSDFYKPFLSTVLLAVNKEAKRAKEKFICEIRSRRGIHFKLDKKHPLQKGHDDIRLFLPFLNTGPGIADRTIFHISTDNNDALVLTEEVDLGGVGPGEFIVPVTFSILESIDKLTLNAIVEWKVIGDSEEKISEFNIDVEAQPIDINWGHLSNLHPYSLDIAVGKDFHGRKDKLDRLLQRASQTRMQSSYITGQRRVGKSSLAKAVEDHIKKETTDCHVLNIECGDFKHPESRRTIDSLGLRLQEFLSTYLPRSADWTNAKFDGSLAPISQLVNLLESLNPTARFLIIIDEFDEINQDLYRHSEIAETFFLNLRSLSGKANISFILIGAERMSFVMSSQGEKLNRFSSESLDSFKQDEEWEDYENLVRGDTSYGITWLDSAVRALYDITNGNPYFTKQVCSKIFERAIKTKDAEISNEEISSSVDELISTLDVNTFQHFWRDGIQGDLNECEIMSLKRCRVLVAHSRALRLGISANVDNIKQNLYSNQLLEADILPILADFCRRNVMAEENGEYKIEIPLFGKWLINHGFNSLIADQLGDELAEEKQAQEDKAYVQDDEITALISSWPSYKGLQLSLHFVREWISQVPSHLDQRILFKLLTNLKIFGDSEIRLILKTLHERVQSNIPIEVRTSKVQRRKDVWVTYLDGPGKSGAQFAGIYAEVNMISTTCVKEMLEIDSIFNKSAMLKESLSAIIIIDDFIGTGNSLSQGIKDFYERNGEVIKSLKIPVYLVVVCSTAKGEDKVRSSIEYADFNSDLFVGQALESRHFAFKNKNIWQDNNEYLIAKDLCQRLGLMLDKHRPLGYGDDGLLLVFSRNCPNNTLPIIHSAGRGENQWHPLFERTKH
jgi:hypothetical protein